jgi:hypothetical protein
MQVTGRSAAGLVMAMVALCLAAAAPAMAQQARTGSAASSPLDPVYACAAITDPAQRLACYDRAVADLRAREQSRDVVAVDRAAVEQVRRESFGFNLPSLPNLFGRRPAETAAAGAAAGAAGAAGAAAGAEAQGGRAPAEAAAEPEDRQTMRVVQVRAGGGRPVLVMESGQVWQFTDTGEITPPRRAPFTVTIRRAALGSYLMTIDGSNRGYRVRRVE